MNASATVPPVTISSIAPMNSVRVIRKRSLTAMESEARAVSPR
ncbi:MAG: hypothetical protein AB2811_13565 [Candidatus Sedimenticola endophacoides]